jgi:hypothetical protein
MFALIDTKNATHIAINIPQQGADKTIPALVGMLENNAVFIRKGWNTIETCAPEMSIQLGEKVFVENSDTEMAILVPGSTSILNDSFVHETPEVMISNAKAIKNKDAEISRLRTELAHLKQRLSDLQDAIAEENE